MPLHGREALVPAALAAVALLLSGCGTYTVTMKYTCTQVENGACLEWSQVGGIQQPACFPGDAAVISRRGPVALAELAAGEEILGLDHATGRPAFTAVRAWLHRDPGAEVPMSAVETEAGVLLASAQHALAVEGGAEYEFAGELGPGRALVAPNGSSIAVRSVKAAVGQGLYAPLTWTSNYFVSSPGMKSGVLAHSFALLRRPRRYEAAWHLLLSAGELLAPSLHELPAGSGEAYIHPVARPFMRLLGHSPARGGLVRRTLRSPAARGFSGASAGEEWEEEEGARPASGESEGAGAAGQGATARRLNYVVAAHGAHGKDRSEEQAVLSYVAKLPPFLQAGWKPTSPVPDRKLPSPDIEEWLQHANLRQGVFNGIELAGLALMALASTRALKYLKVVLAASSEEHEEHHRHDGPHGPLLAGQ